MKKITQEYFTFSKRDRNGILLLLCLILLLLLLPHIVPFFLANEETDFSAFREDIARFQAAVAVNQEDNSRWNKNELEDKNPKIAVEMFDFNPNELTYEQGKALGLSDEIARRIPKYLKSGRKFYKKEDLKTIYGFSEDDYQRLAPFAIFDEQIEGKLEGRKDKVGGKHYNNSGKKKEKKFYASNKNTKKSYKEFELKLEIFDPNELSYEEARHLGMSHQAAKALTNFVKKSRDGKPFKKKEDVKMVYGFTEEDYTRLEEYIEIEEDALVLMAEKRGEGSKEKKEKPATFSFEEKPPIRIDINQASVEDWKKLKGIGNSFGNRIVKYRNLLGGFTHVEQLKEVYGLDAILYVEIREYLINEHPELIQKINVNTADELSLKKHSYIDEKLAKAIVKKRIKKGDFQNVNELQKIGGMDNELFQKLSPYLSVR